MAILSVLIFATPDAAPKKERHLLDLQARQRIAVQDAAMVTWPTGKKPKTEQLHSLGGPGELSGAFWGMLFGLIFSGDFFGPEGADVTKPLGAIFADYGIDDNFIVHARVTVTEGSSALFLLSDAILSEDAIAALGDEAFEIIATSFPAHKADALHADFGI